MRVTSVEDCTDCWAAVCSGCDGSIAEGHIFPSCNSLPPLPRCPSDCLMTDATKRQHIKSSMPSVHGELKDLFREGGQDGGK